MSSMELFRDELDRLATRIAALEESARQADLRDSRDRQWAAETAKLANEQTDVMATVIQAWLDAYEQAKKQRGDLPTAKE